ncbi:MAG: phosphoenolpyruvate carboxykinase (ATP) [Campylobacteraceae bacterium]|jgi:phosphoenolpyruvate carboxykinase (ATP)|nr:phosphoenolpyruvate carboxykinase (ATP) [Campylobacteraceae bacterium]
MSLRANKIDELGLSNTGKIFYHLSYDELYNHENANKEGEVTSLGAFTVNTGIFTGRSPKDKYFVKQNPSQEHIAWGAVNKPITKELFNKLLNKAKKQLSNKDIYIEDVYCGASTASRKNIRFVTEVAWQAHFVKNMFIRPSDKELEKFNPDFVVYNACKCVNEDYKNDGLNSEVFVVFNIEENIAVIGGTWYGGEMKKGIFSMMNYWLPLEGKLSMHCSANVGEDGNTALFFGLSGTGKTTLSTDPKRKLIGDDEHGWDENGIFNFEGGCYAKCINLDPKSEPEIYEAIKKDALLENVVVDKSGIVDFSDASKTENTRVSYPIEHIKNHEPSLMAGHPQNIIFLTADAFGILPPVSKLDKEQAMYYFLSGYTAKVAGTERGVTEPVATFSACFGEAFLPLHPTVYAKLLGEKIDKHKVNVFLVNTGWSGGVYGVGKRMSIKATRTCINAILDGSINKCEYEKLDIFNLNFPKSLNGIESTILNPRNTWSDKTEYDAIRVKLAEMFIKNFKRYSNNGCDYSKAGPKLI